MISIDHESPYNTYSSYPDYSTPSKLEAFDYNYWPANTHNILTIPTINPIQTPPTTIEPLGSNSPVHLSQINSTHHHHHIHQHLYPSSTSSNDPSNWLTPNDYQPPTPYRHYPYPNNQFYDQSQWSTPPPVPSSSSIPIKFESPYSPPSYFESSQPLSDSREEPLDSSDQQPPPNNWYKSQLTPVPPKNPVNGMSHIFN